MTLLERARESKVTRLVNGDLSIEGAVIIWRNFAGAPTKVNPAGGKRTFALVLDEGLAEELTNEGWNVKYREPKVDGDDALITTEIVANMESKYPPKVVLISEFRGRMRQNELDGDTIGHLDDIRLENVDLVIHPYEHGRGVYKVKGYLKAIFVTQAQSDAYFGGKYSNIDYEPEED